MEEVGERKYKTVYFSRIILCSVTKKTKECFFFLSVQMDKEKCKVLHLIVCKIAVFYNELHRLMLSIVRSIAVIIGMTLQCVLQSNNGNRMAVRERENVVKNSNGNQVKHN